MGYGFTPREAAAYDVWKTAAPEPPEDACDRCRLSTCDDCEFSEDFCEKCSSTDCQCLKGD